MRRRWLWLGVVALLATACDGSGGGAAQPTRTLDIAGYAEHACTLLTAKQLDGLGLASFQATPYVNHCRWTNKQAIFDVITDPAVNPVEARAKSPGAAKTEQIVVDGVSALKIRESSGMCYIAVATGATQGFTTIGANDDTVDWCDTATRAATLIIQNLGH